MTLQSILKKLFFKEKILILLATMTIVCPVMASDECENSLRDGMWAIQSPENASTRALIAAAGAGNLAGIRRAYDEGARLDGHDGFYTALGRAAQYGKADATMLLIELGANINQQDAYYRTPLSWAAQLGHLNVIETLVGAGANINDHDGSKDPSFTMTDTPLHHAANYGRLPVVRYLISRGANVHAKGLLGATPLYDSARQKVAIAKELRKAGADVNVQTSTGMTPLIDAVLVSNVAVMRFLLREGADPNFATIDERSALGAAYYTGRKEVIDLLLRAGARLTEREKSGQSAARNTQSEGSSDHSKQLSGIDYSKDYYSILGLSQNASTEDIKKVYRVLTFRWHPDRNPGNQNAVAAFKEAVEAYEVLSNREKRFAYDAYRTMH